MTEETAKVWSLSANDILDDEVDIIDSDLLLDEDDLKKPDPASLRGIPLGPYSPPLLAFKYKI